MVTGQWLRSRRWRLIIFASCALLGYGAWAYVANADYGVATGLRAALTQGGYAFLVTLVMTSLLEFLYQWSRPLHRSAWIAFLATCATLYLSSWGVNALAGTPRIFWTILPGMVIGTVYTANYVMLLNRFQKP